MSNKLPRAKRVRTKRVQQNITIPPPQHSPPSQTNTYRNDGSRRRVPRQVTEAGICHLYEPVMLQRTRPDDHHARRRVVRCNVVRQLLAREITHIFFRAQDGAAKATFVERHFVQVVQYYLCGQEKKARQKVCRMRMYRSARVDVFICVTWRAILGKIPVEQFLVGRHEWPGGTTSDGTKNYNCATLVHKTPDKLFTSCHHIFAFHSNLL